MIFLPGAEWASFLPGYMLPSSDLFTVDCFQFLNYDKYDW